MANKKLVKPDQKSLIPNGNTETLIATAKVGEESKAMVLYNTTLEEAPHVFTSFASNTYQNAYSPNISIRDSFDKFDYQFYRPGEYIPVDEKGKIAACMYAYKESGNGIIANIIDLMGDLVVQGIDVVHKKKKNEKFAKAWFNKTVKGPEFSERFANLFCRAGNVVLKRDIQKISLKKVRQYYQGTADENYKDQFQPPPKLDEIEIVKREIPVRYTMLNPLILEVFSPELSMFLDNSDIRYGLSIPMDIVRKVMQPITVTDQELVSAIPVDVVAAIRKGDRIIPLDKAKIENFYYKKDDWEVWATPMIYKVLSDVNALKKMKLADLATLDGVLSQIRVWKIGSLEHNTKPTLPAMNKLASVLMQGVAGGILDLIWGPDIEMQEVTSTLHQYLGETKYIPILKAIYEGLGVPPLFTGASDKGGFTTNFLSIQTFIVRLEYIRSKLRTFWDKELVMLQKALDWDEPATLVFDRMNLNDEASFLQILLHMVDRDILSEEALIEMVGNVPEIEKFRVKRQMNDRKKGKIPPKASPFHKPDYEHSWIEKFIQMGEVTPSQVGLELEPMKKGEKTPVENKALLDQQTQEAKGMPNDIGGRPSGKKDKKKRKQKTVKIQRGVSELIQNTVWATDIQDKISNILTPVYLESLNKKNLRQLNTDESTNLESLKFALLANMKPKQKLEENTIKDMLDTKKLEIPEFMSTLLCEMINKHTEDTGSKPSIDKTRQLQALTHAAYFEMIYNDNPV